MKEAPSAIAAVREVIKGQQKQLQQRYRKELRELKQRKDLEERRLMLALTGLDGEDEGSQSRKQQRSRRRRRSRAPANPAAVRERRDAVLRFLIEQDKPLSRSDICRSLDLSSHVVRTALDLLYRDSKVARVGTGAGTRYRATGSAGTGPAAPAPLAGTPQGRIGAVLQERGWASVDELSQAAGMSRSEARRGCEALERDGEIYATEREGRSVYAFAKLSIES